MDEKKDVDIEVPTPIFRVHLEREGLPQAAPGFRPRFNPTLAQHGYNVGSDIETDEANKAPPITLRRPGTTLTVNNRRLSQEGANSQHAPFPSPACRARMPPLSQVPVLVGERVEKQRQIIDDDAGRHQCWHHFFSFILFLLPFLLFLPLPCMVPCCEGIRAQRTLVNPFLFCFSDFGCPLARCHPIPPK